MYINIYHTYTYDILHQIHDLSQALNGLPLGKSKPIRRESNQT